MPRLTRRELLAAAGLAAAGLAASCAAPKTEAPQTAPKALTDLEKKLRGTVLRPGSPEYAELATPRNLRFAATMPEAVVRCAGVEDVVATVTWARDTQTPFAIRGGGHNYADASSSRGILISTRAMNAASINGTTLKAQAGVRNADLAKLLPQGGNRLLLPGGNCPAVGVAGLTLGGGIGPNAPWAGLTADRLRKVTMVPADGKVVTASGTENPELFWGLRGGAGGNLGVVTDLEYEMVEVPVTRATTAEFTFHGRDTAVAAAVAFQKMRAGAERIVTGNLYLGHSKDDRGGDIEGRVQAQAIAGAADAHGLFGPLMAVPGVRAEIVERPWWEVYGWYVTEPSPAYSFWDRSLYADDYLTEDVLGQALDVVRRFPSGSGPDREAAMGIYGWVGGAVNDVAPDATAYVHRSAKVLVEMSAGWPTPKDSVLPDNPIPPEIKDWEDELWQTLLPHTTGRSYQNFPDPGLEDWASAYYGDNLGRLEGLKATWDPQDVFNYGQGIPLPR
jgi:FAD/FMN-containing dehydrogenase